MKEEVIERYKSWVGQYVEYYGDFESADELTFKEDGDYIFVGHPDGAEDYGEGECGGVNGDITLLRSAFKGDYHQTIQWEDFSDYFSCGKGFIKNIAKEFGLTIKELDDGEALIRVKGCKDFDKCSTEQISNYLKFFDVLGEYDNGTGFSYFTLPIPGHDDYWSIEEVNGVEYLFWITRYNPNF